jgi:hypothetical protein
MSPQRLSWLNLPIGKLKVLYDLLGHSILLIVGECARKPRMRASPFLSPIFTQNRRSSNFVHITQSRNKTGTLSTTIGGCIEVSFAVGRNL